MNCEKKCGKKCCPWMLVIIALLLVILPMFVLPQGSAVSNFFGGIYVVIHSLIPILGVFALIKYLTCKKSGACPCPCSCCAPGSKCCEQGTCKKEGPCA